MSVEVVRSPALANVRHGFLGRRGGASEGLAWGLNVGLGSNDDAGHVTENRCRAVDAVAPGHALVTVYQVHSATVAVVTEAFADDARPRADAMVTDRTNLVLGIVTADCAPVLFADAAAGVIAAAHAGWKGALGGVVDATVAAMERLGAHRDRIAAAVGPCIAQASYEVDGSFRDRFAADDGQFFVAGHDAEHWQFDLEGFVALRLRQADVRTIDTLGLDTYADDDRFFSFRRATHRKEADYGRQMSLIALP